MRIAGYKVSNALRDPAGKITQKDLNRNFFTGRTTKDCFVSNVQKIKSGVSFGARKLTPEQKNAIISKLLNLDVKFSEECYQLHSGQLKIDPEQLKEIQQAVADQFLKDFSSNVEDKEFKRAQILVNTGGAVNLIADVVIKNYGELMELGKKTSRNSTDHKKMEKLQKELDLNYKGLQQVLSQENPKYKFAELQYHVAAKKLLADNKSNLNEYSQMFAVDILKKYADTHTLRFFIVDKLINDESKSDKVRERTIWSILDIVERIQPREDIMEEIIESLEPEHFSTSEDLQTAAKIVQYHLKK